MIILDLEDAVAEPDKATARAAAVEAAQAGFGGRPVAIRINAVGSAHHGPDMLAAGRSGAGFVVLPKAESVRDVRDSEAACGRPIVTMIETPRGVLEAAAIAEVSAGLIAGTNDLAAALRIPAGGGRSGLAVSLQRIVLAGRATGIPVFDGVYNRLDDRAGLEAEAVEGRNFGFDGKSVIHPHQIETVNRVFTPSAAGSRCRRRPHRLRHGRRPAPRRPHDRGSARRASPPAGRPRPPLIASAGPAHPEQPPSGVSKDALPVSRPLG
jgi:citrate lyase subunit beta/citryl-CoA lyase